MNILDKTLKGLDGLALRLVWLGGALLVIAALIVTVDVILRKIFNISMAGSDELSGYAFGIATSLSLTYALLHRSNMRVDALYQHLPIWLRSVLDILGNILLLTFIGYVTYRASSLLLDTYANQSRSISPLQTPLAIPQTAWFAGLVLFVVTGAVMTISSIISLFKRDWVAIHKLMGIKSLDEQIEEES
ncbi:MAG: TRAP transporter small permease [Rhodospirillales bacterium]|nr:TRAP transporter small permease [Rhodospirillales bacterium]